MQLAAIPFLFALALPGIADPGGVRSVGLPTSLRDLQDRCRPVLIFAPRGDARIDRQVHSLAIHRTELLDRQVMLVPFDQKDSKTSDSQIITSFSNEEVSIRQRFHIAPADFTVILLGKDGGEKFRSHTPVSIDQLTSLIDAMPMRRQEMKTRPAPDRGL